jgi:hypothetical protein
MSHLSSLVIALVLSAGTISQSLAQSGLPPKPSCVKDVKKTIVVKRGKVFNGGGCLFSWKGRGYPSHCRAKKEISEKEPPMFVLESGATLKNLQMECALDGIHTTRNNVIDGIVNRDVEEDAVTVGENIVIRNSKFFSCQDKCIQMNNAKKVLLENNLFVNAKSAILANWGQDVTARNNSFENVNVAIRARSRQGKNSDITVSKNKFRNVKCAHQTQEKGKIIDKGGNSFRNVSKQTCR